MANSLDAGISEHWDKDYQITHYKNTVYRAFAETRLTGQLKVGDTVHRQYITKKVAKDVGSDGSYSRQDITDTDETLVINQKKESTFFLDDINELQNNVPVRNKHSADTMAALMERIDGQVLSQIQNATNDVDDADITSGGTDNNGITATESNVMNIFVKAKEKLLLGNVIHEGQRFSGIPKQDKVKRFAVAAISPRFYSQLLIFVGGKESVFGDKISMNGHAGRYMGFELFISNNLYWTATLALPTNPSNNDTMVINGVTWTFKTSLTGGAAEGEILIGAAAANTADNIVAAINEAAGDTSTYEEVSAADRDLLNGITATDGTTEVTFDSVKGYIAVSETFTAAGNVFTAAKQIEHQFFGLNRSVNVVIQKKPNKRTQPRTGFIGDDVITWTLWGSKVFNDNAPQLVDVKVRSDAYA